jgi:hypothetical protein
MRPDKALLGDKVGDYDGAKVAGFGLLIICAIGYFMQLDGWQTFMYGGGSMILGKCWKENT